MTRKLKLLHYILFFISAFTFDRITKIWALDNLMSKNIKLFDGLNLTLVWNRGISWGLFSFKSLLGFVIVTSIILAVLILFTFHVRYQFKKRRDIYFEVLILVGAVSNMFDRFLYGGVADFIDFYISKWHWPTFNFADLFVVIGVFGVLGRYLYYVYFRKAKRGMF